MMAGPGMDGMWGAEVNVALLKPLRVLRVRDSRAASTLASPQLLTLEEWK